MTHWNSNLFRRQGGEKGYAQDYLDALVHQAERNIAANVPVIFSLAHLARLSDTLYADLHGFVSRADIHLQNFPYKNFPISKRTGGKRWISIPVPPLMAVQQWINENILRKASPPHPAAFAYVPKRKLVEHAKRHCGADWLVKVDIRDFFSNISERQVFDVFVNLGYTKLLSFEMARLCTRVTPNRKGRRWTRVSCEQKIPEYYSALVGSLPQGAPTSPALSNFVCIELDKELTQLAESKSATYSRYADDLCFSFIGGSRQSAFDLKREVSKILWKYGFEENAKKTRIIPPGSRKLLTGLNVNADRPTIPKEVRDMVRMHLYYAKARGISKHCEERGFRSVIGFKNHLLGLIGYIASINKNLGDKFLEEFNSLPWINFEI